MGRTVHLGQSCDILFNTGDAVGTEAEVDAGTRATELQAHMPAGEIEKLQLLLTSYGESTSDSEASGDDCSDGQASGDDQSPVGTGESIDQHFFMSQLSSLKFHLLSQTYKDVI